MKALKAVALVFVIGILADLLFIGGMWYGGHKIEKQYNQMIGEYLLIPKNEDARVIADIFGWECVEYYPGVCE